MVVGETDGTDRETDRLRDRQRGGRERQGRQEDGETDRLTERQTEGADREMGETDRRCGRERWGDRQPERQIGGG